MFILAGTTASNAGSGGSALVEPAKPQFKVVKGKPGSVAKDGAPSTAPTARPPTAAKSNASGGPKSKSTPAGGNDLPKEQLISDDVVESQLNEYVYLWLVLANCSTQLPLGLDC